MATQRRAPSGKRPANHKVVVDEVGPKIVVDDEVDDEVDDTTPAPADDTADDELDDELDDEVDDEVDDIEADEVEADDEIDDEPAGRTFEAKQVATILSKRRNEAIDAKMLRKFFRSEASTTKPVGPGGRYQFTAEEVNQVEKEFAAWRTGSRARGPRGTTTTKSTTTTRSRGRQAPARAEVIEEDDEVLELDDELEDVEPSSDDLAEIDDEIDDEVE